MKKTILIYDDDEEILLLCRTILKKFGFETKTKPECDAIIDDVKSLKPDLILMDLWIPGLGGEKAVSTVKRDEELKDIPILLFSANPDIKQIANKVSADGYVPKPFEVKALVRIIRHHLN
jgi:two-component system cell cycle response regulator DivK